MGTNLLTFMLMLATSATSATTSPGPTETPAPFSCDAPAPLSPLPHSPRMLLPSPGAVVSKDLTAIYFASLPDQFVQMTLEGSNGDWLGGGGLEAADSAPAKIHADNVSKASIPTEATYAQSGVSSVPPMPVLKAGVRYRVFFVPYPRCPQRYEGDSGFFMVR